MLARGWTDGSKGGLSLWTDVPDTSDFGLACQELNTCMLMDAIDWSRLAMGGGRQ
jgi:hypothetical protein